MAKIKYYDIKSLLMRVPDAHYYMVIGERTNGKSYSILNYCLERYVLYGEEFAYIRRFDEDIKYKRGSQVYKNLVNNKVIEKLTKGEWNDVYYYEDNTINVHVSNLRNKLKKVSGQDHVETVWGIGYRLREE